MDEIPETETRFDYWRKRIGLFAGPILGLLVYAAVSQTDLQPAAQALAGVLAFTVIYWVCEPIPLAATALLSPLLCVIVGVTDVKKMFVPFASPIVFLFIGSFILAEGAQKYGLDKRIALKVLGLRGVARSPTTILAAVGIVTGFLSMWMSNTATTALILPIVLGLIHANPQLAKPRVAAPLFLMISFSATAGGLATPIGTPPNLISIGLLEEQAGIKVSFVEWMWRGVPLAMLLIGVLVLLLRPWGHAHFDNHGEMTKSFREQGRGLGRIKLGEWNVVSIFLVALVCWVAPSLAMMIWGKDDPFAQWFEKHLPEEMVGLAAGLMLFCLPTNLKRWEFTVTWRDAQRIDWGTIFLFAGGMALGSQIRATGLDETIGKLMMSAVGEPSLWKLVAAGIAISIALSEFTSNTAAANVTVVMMLGAAKAASVDPVPIGIATCLACSFGFMLPVSTGPNAMVYGTGRVPLRKMIALGVAFDIIGGILIWLLIRLTG